MKKNCEKFAYVRILYFLWNIHLASDRYPQYVLSAVQVVIWYRKNFNIFLLGVLHI